MVKKHEKNYLPRLLADHDHRFRRERSNYGYRKKDGFGRQARHKFINANQADSVYTLPGANFKAQIPATTWATVSSQLASLTPFTKVEFVKKDRRRQRL